MSNEPEAAKYKPPAPLSCVFCGAQRHTKGVWIGSGVGVIWPHFHERCTCPGAIAELEAENAERERVDAEERAKAARERIRRITRDSGMGRRFMDRTFATFHDTPDNRKALRISRDYADQFGQLSDKKRNGLFITGPKGVGKTHLAAAIANQLMAQGTEVICMTMIDMLERIKQAFSDRAPEADEYRVMSKYKRVPLLIIDDMGKERPTEWTAAKIYEIINARYEAYMPIIVTTNYGDDELARRMTPQSGDDMTADATIDRLREMCEGVFIGGESWRSR